MTPDDLRAWLSVIATLIAIGTAVYAWLSARSKGNEKQLAELQKEMGKLSRRVDHVETELTHLPDKDAVHDLQLAVTRVEGTISTMAEAFKAIERTTRRVEDYLIKKGGD